MRTVENQYCLNLTDCQSWIKVCQGGSSKFSFTGKLSLKGSVNEYIKHRPTFPPGLGNQTQLARTGGAKIFWFFVKSTNVRNYLKRGNTQIRLSWESGSCICWQKFCLRCKNFKSLARLGNWPPSGETILTFIDLKVTLTDMGDICQRESEILQQDFQY